MVKIIKFNHKRAEKKWQTRWERSDYNRGIDFSKKKKFYLLIEFPYPSGAGLHVGHIRSWSAMDAYARKKRMEGLNVLYPIGWDAFGLPAENYAIKTGVHPSKTVPENIANFKRQIKSLGLSFDWSREIDTSDSKYYKWTQWIFVQLFKNGLAYQEEAPVNWCPFCKTNLADEEVLSDGTHERCGKLTEKRPQKQWLLRITKYADRLLEDLNTLDYSGKIAQQQINWIGKKEWIDISYYIEGTKEKIAVSTTRPDTNFGATFIVVAPEYPILFKEKNMVPKKYQKDVYRYIQEAKSKTELERISEVRKKTGVFTGLYAINQLNNVRMPIWVADFALMSVGTGAVVGVPGHDIRDFDFAKEFGLPIVRVVIGEDGDTSEITKKEQVEEEEGTMVNSQFLDGMDTHKAIRTIMDYIEEKGWGKRVFRYHIHDWIFSRQHYWGEPIPIIHCKECGPVPVPEKDLPVELPYLEKYQPSGTGESPLVHARDWLKAACPKCGGIGRRETDTMPNWAGSNWYYVAYLFAQKLGAQNSSNKEHKHIFSENQDLLKYWMPVDLYQGGFEHTTLHLLYSRFIYKFLHDIGAVPTVEPYAKRRSHGIVLGVDGKKMSKSFANVVNPDEIVEKYGADSLRLYEMFMGPFDQMVVWSEESLEGCYRFVNRAWRAFNAKVKAKTPSNLRIKLNQTIKKVGSDIEEFKFNTAVAALMEFLNAWEDQDGLEKEDAKKFAQILAPFAPHLAEEVWVNILGQPFSVHKAVWPRHDANLVKEETATIVVEINGKLRGTLVLSREKALNEADVVSMAKKDSGISKWLKEGEVKRTIFVPGKLLNFVIK